jgi:DNA-binding CsgD family transcriptional regulator
LEARSHDLEEVNSALRALLKHMSECKKELENNVLSNVKQLVVPYLERLKIGQMDRGQLRLAGIVEENLNNITSPFVGRLSSNFTSFSPMEVRVAELVKDGKANKEIAELLCISINTILSHRKNLRTKLGLKKKRINLRNYLLSLEE